jgi:hypothetical protein
MVDSAESPAGWAASNTTPTPTRRNSRTPRCGQAHIDRSALSRSLPDVGPIAPRLGGRYANRSGRPGAVTDGRRSHVTTRQNEAASPTVTPPRTASPRAVVARNFWGAAGSASCSKDAVQHERGHDGDNVTAEDAAIDVHRRAPIHIRPGRSRRRRRAWRRGQSRQRRRIRFPNRLVHRLRRVRRRLRRGLPRPVRQRLRCARTVRRRTVAVSAVAGLLYQFLTSTFGFSRCDQSIRLDDPDRRTGGINHTSRLRRRRQRRASAARRHQHRVVSDVWVRPRR